MSINPFTEAVIETMSSLEIMSTKIKHKAPEPIDYFTPVKYYCKGRTRFEIIRESLKSVGTTDDSIEKYEFTNEAMLALVEILNAVEKCSDLFDEMDSTQWGSDADETFAGTYPHAREAILNVLSALK